MSNTDETLYVITEGDETPQQVVLDIFAGGARTWKGPYRDRKLAEAHLGQFLRRLYQEPKPGHYQIHAFNLTGFSALLRNNGFHLSQAA